MADENKKPRYKETRYLGLIIAIVAIVVTIILAIWQYSPPPSDFGISVNPMKGEVHQGGVITTAITIKGIQEYEHPVSLSASGLPSGIVVTFIPPIGGPTPSYTSTVMINVDPIVPAGDYEIVKKGTGADGKEHSCSYTLTVKASVTPTPPVTPSPSPAHIITPTPASATTPTPTLTPTPTPTISPTLTPTISILTSHTSLYGGEDLSVTVRWNNIPVGWKLVVSLEGSETDCTRLAENDANKIVSGSGEETFTLKVKPTTETHHHAKVCACFYEGTNWKNVFEKKDVTVYPNEVSIIDYSPSPVSIIDCSPSPVHGGEELNVKVRWSNIPTGWKLVVSLEGSETDCTRLAENDANKIVSGSGEETFTLKVKPTTETHHHAKVCACFYEGTNWKNVFEKKNIEVRP